MAAVQQSGPIMGCSLSKRAGDETTNSRWGSSCGPRVAAASVLLEDVSSNTCSSHESFAAGVLGGITNRHGNVVISSIPTDAVHHTVCAVQRPCSTADDVRVVLNRLLL